MEVTVRLNDLGWRILPGHRLRLALSTQMWPMAWPLAQEATVVWLRATPETRAARVGDPSSRPLLADSDPVEALRRLASERTPAYETAADAVIDTDGLDVSMVGALVVDALPATDGAVQ